MIDKSDAERLAMAKAFDIVIAWLQHKGTAANVSELASMCEFVVFVQTHNPDAPQPAATLKAALGWRDIADRPKDGTKYWATDGENQFTENQPPGHFPGRWDWFEEEQYWGGSISTYKATHFMPLPAPPAPGGDK
jgi:hypothetical protein